MKKLQYGFAMLLMVLAFAVVGTTSVYASSTSEIEPNDSKETAQAMEANYEKAALVAVGKRPDQHVYNGSTSKTDEDWYKVYLKAGTQYVTCNESSYNFEIYDNNNNLITNESYVKDTFGPKAFEFSVPSTGYYYVKVFGNTSSATKYKIMVGGPTYLAGSCSIQLNTVTMRNNNDTRITLDLTNREILPEDAVIYSMNMSKVNSSAVGSIILDNLTSGKTVALNMYSWDKLSIQSLNLQLRSRWRIEFGYSGNGSCSPKLQMNYVYPLKNVPSEDNIQISQ